MVKLLYNLALVLVVFSFVYTEEVQDAKPAAVEPKEELKVVQPPNIKIYIQSNVKRIDPPDLNKNTQVGEAKPVDSKGEEKQNLQQQQQLSLFNLFNMNPFSKIFNFPDQIQQTDDNQQPTYRHRLFIFRIFPSLGQNGEQEEGKVEKKLLGGGGENDPDIIRFKLDDDSRNMMTGQDHHMMSMVTNRLSMHSMMEHIKNMFSFMESNQNESDEDDDSTKHLPFVIRTDDGNEAIVPNEIGDENRMKENKNCMMLSFMRLKASIYYRTILHLLFFTGILLFILSMIMITFKTFRKKRYSTLRYTPHSMDVSSIDGDLIKDKSRYGSPKSWYDITSDRSTLIRGPDNKLVLIQAPPAYDQVIVGDASKLLEDDAKSDTKSLPPSYDIVNEKK